MPATTPGMTTSGVASVRGVSASALAFLVASVTLSAQILVHRVVSAKLVNNYAFLVISLTMLGFAVSGVLLTRLLDRFLHHGPDAFTLCASGFVLSVLGACILFDAFGTGAQFSPGLRPFLLQSVRWISAALVFALPFACSGLMLGALLSDPRLPTNRIYGFDLLGSGLGAVLVVPAVQGLGVETSLLLACSLLLVGTLALTRPRGRGARLVASVAALGIAYTAVDRDRLFALPAGRHAGAARASGLEYVQWDSVARVEVSRIPPIDPAQVAYPSLVGDDPTLLASFTRTLTQNGYAYTLMPQWDGRQPLTGVDRTIYSAAYQARAVAAPRVLVIGVGGGFDVVTALQHDARHLTGVEVNAAVLDVVQKVYRDQCAAWATHPRVELVADEGRHFLATHADRYDIVQLSGVDSYSGTPAAAHVFSESYLYTEEAFDLYLSRLTDSGILNLMRLEHRPPREMLRALVTAVAALRRAGIEAPARHLVTVTDRNGGFTALLVKKTPFSDRELSHLAAWANGNPFFTISAAPGMNAARRDMYQLFLDIGSPAREHAFVAAYPFDISPASDNRPFFFRFSRWSHLWSRDPILRRALPTMELSLLLLAAGIGLAVLLCVLLPLRLVASRPSGPAWTSVRFAAFFAAIGAGYFGIEIALIQRFGLFLGHPNYALSVVLATLLVASGIGAAASERLLRALRRMPHVAYSVAGVLLLERLTLLPRLPSLVGLPFAARTLLVAASLLPIGLLLGAFLPIGLARLRASAPQLVPWAWGINGVFSVLAPVLAVGVSITWGIDALMLSAIPVYLAAGWLLPAAPGAQRAPEVS
jgi:hypothetical protein